MSKIKKRPDGRYQKGVFVGKDSQGKNVYKYVYGKTQREVEKKASELRGKLEKGIDLSVEGLTFEYWVKKWLAYKKNMVSEAQYKNYESEVKKFSRFFPIQASTLKISDFQSLIDEYSASNPSTGKPASKKKLKDIKMTASQVFEFAIMNRALDFNPAKYCVIPKESPVKERRALTVEEQRWIRETPGAVQLPAMIMLYSGLRLGECLALKWTDIDLEKATIDVNKTLLAKEKPPRIKQGAKTKSGIRKVNIPKVLVDFLRKQPHDPFDFVVHDDKGELFSMSKWSSCWKSYLSELNLKYGDFSQCIYDPRELEVKSKFKIEIPTVIDPFTAHYLRHTHATNLFNADNDILYISKQLGHASPDITMNIYAHLVREREIQNAAKLNDYLEKMIDENVKIKAV